MKWYFASRTKHQEKIKEISQFLAEKGEVVSSDWVYQGILTPYEDHRKEVEELSKNVVEAILGTDIFVLISDPEGTDMFIECGIALGQCVSTNSKMKIYIVGPYAKRSLMQLHPRIVHVEDIEELFKKENIDSSSTTLPIFYA